MALVKPECAAHLPRTEIERHVSVGHAVAGYVCVQCSPAAACSLSRVKAHPLACTHCLWVCWCLRMCRDLVRAFRRPDRRDLVQMIFRTAEAVAPCKARGDSGRGATTPLAGDHMDCQRRADVGARLFRLCSPVVTTLLDDFGFSMSSPMHCACARRLVDSPHPLTPRVYACVACLGTSGRKIAAASVGHPGGLWAVW